jgi:putative spermidine/putrescine transport system ATP-binding protein
MTVRLVPTAITLRTCGKTFADGTRAVAPLDLAIAAGETVVILGPSGCGKTTTLRLIAGLEQPDAGGKVMFGDDDVTAIPIDRRNIGMVFQAYALFPNFNVLDNIAYGLRVRGVAKAERHARARELMAMMRLDALAQRRVDQLSGGQKQRVALARALIIEPRAMLLDEALTALDAKLRDTLRVEINALLRRLGITTIYVTHDQAEAMSLGDRIIVMEGGEIAQVGTPYEIYHAPATRFVADFIGTMNAIAGRVSGGDFVCAAGAIKGVRLPADCTEILFRPEAVSIAPPGAAALTGKVAATFFLGDRTRLMVDEIGPKPLMVETSGFCRLAVGETVSLAVNADAVMTLPGGAKA